MKVLLIEDDRVTAESIRRGLAHEGFTVDIAGDGDDGWWMATEASYDAILLDIMLPKRNRYCLCRDLRERGDWTPVVMLTAKDGELDQIEGLDFGADDYLTKPFSFALLVARLRSAVRRSQQRCVAPTDAGLLHADPKSRPVWANGVEIQLTAREYDILEYLLRRSGEVVSKQQILSGVWEFDFDGDPNIVEVYVARLRRKLQAAAGMSVIGTVRGAGYRIDGNAA